MYREYVLTVRICIVCIKPCVTFFQAMATIPTNHPELDEKPIVDNNTANKGIELSLLTCQFHEMPLKTLKSALPTVPWKQSSQHCPTVQHRNPHHHKRLASSSWTFRMKKSASYAHTLGETLIPFIQFFSGWKWKPVRWGCSVDEASPSLSVTVTLGLAVQFPTCDAGSIIHSGRDVKITKRVAKTVVSMPFLSHNRISLTLPASQSW